MLRRAARRAGARVLVAPPEDAQQKMSAERQTEEMRSICAKLGLPLSPALVKKFHAFYRDVIAKLDYQSSHITGMYMRAMVYRYTGTTRPKKEFLEGFNAAVFDRAVKRVREWLDGDGDGGEGAPSTTVNAARETVCSLYSMLQ